MLTIVIETRNDEEGLARTLASLVSGAVEGIVRDVIVCDRGSTDQTHYVAEHAGCVFLGEGGLPAAIRQAKADWLLILEPGARLAEGWAELVMNHATHSSPPAHFVPARGGEQPFLRRIFARRRPLEQGLLITKRQALVLAEKSDGAEALARGLATRKLPVEIHVAPAKA